MQAQIGLVSQNVLRRSTILAFLIGGLLGAIALATFQAVGAVEPPPVGGNLAAALDSDFTLTVRESYLTRIASQQVRRVESPVPLENVRVNVVPGQKLLLLGDARFMGQRFQVSTLLDVAVVDGQIEVRGSDVRVGTLPLPMDLNEVVVTPINRELARLVGDGRLDVVDVATSTGSVVVRMSTKK